MGPWYIATERFGPWRGAYWDKYTSWSGLGALRELITLDNGLCPTVLPEIEQDFWPHIVNEDFMLHFFTDLEFLLTRIEGIPERNLLCVYRNPPHHPVPPTTPINFGFVGYDVVDIHGDVSALTNFGPFPDVFAADELLPYGLLADRERAVDVQAGLRALYPDHSHTDCHVWAVFRASEDEGSAP